MGARGVRHAQLAVGAWPLWGQCGRVMAPSVGLAAPRCLGVGLAVPRCCWAAAACEPPARIASLQDAKSASCRSQCAPKPGRPTLAEALRAAHVSSYAQAADARKQAALWAAGWRAVSVLAPLLIAFPLAYRGGDLPCGQACQGACEGRGCVRHEHPMGSAFCMSADQF